MLPRLKLFGLPGIRRLQATAHAFADVEYEAPALFEAISTAAPQRISSQSLPEILMKTMDAFFIMDLSAPVLLSSIAHTMACRYRSFSTDEIANVARRCAYAGICAAPLMHQVVKHIDDYVDAFSLEDMERFNLTIIWQVTANAITRMSLKSASITTLIASIQAYATHGVTNPEFYVALSNAITHDLDMLNPRQLALVARYFAKAGIPHKETFDSIAVAAIARIHEFSDEELTTLAWSYSTACVVAPALLEAISLVGRGSVRVET